MVSTDVCGGFNLYAGIFKLLRINALLNISSKWLTGFQ
jgi:hypothetical protein